MSDHNPIYHLKDAYFLEVTKPLWPRDWQTLDEVPEFLRRPYNDAGEPMPAVEEFNEAMSGKVLIPQPFADLDSLYAIADLIAVLVDRHVIVGTLDELQHHTHPWIRSYFHGPRARAAMNG